MGVLIAELEQAGDDGKHLLLALRGTDGNRYEFAIPSSRISNTIAMMLKASTNLPVTANESPPASRIDGVMQVASGEDMKASLVLQFGPVTLGAPLSDTQLASLVTDMRALLPNLDLRKN